MTGPKDDPKAYLQGLNAANIENKDHWVESKLPDLDITDEEEISFE